MKEKMEKVKAECAVFGECGGCAYQDIAYHDELQIKEKNLYSLLEGCELSEDVFHPIVSSPEEYYYRHRLDLKLVQTKKKEVFIGFTPIQRRGVLPIDKCSIAKKAIAEFMPTLRSQVMDKITPKYRQANLVVKTSDDGRVYWGGIGRRSLQQSPADYLWTEIKGRKIFFSLDTFFQANLSILPRLFDTIISLNVLDKETEFYDLYGGVGFFGLGLLDYVKKVVLMEDNPASVKLAKYNVAYHGLEHFQVLEGPVETVLPEYMSQQGSSMKKVAMIDPPRAGLSAEALQFMTSLKQFEKILYLSCNPEALARDLKGFKKEDWLVEAVIPFDFFPKTKHLETLVLIKNSK